MRIAATGFVAESAGSIASANAVLLRGLLTRGVEVDFFSKSSFVDPRPVASGIEGFRFCDSTNRHADALRRKLASIPVISAIAVQCDVWSYNRLLVRRIRESHRTRNYDAILWMGDYSRGTVLGVPTLSFVQGPPGTDARSIIDRASEIRALAGIGVWLKWRVLAAARLSRWGLPTFGCSDHFVVGSRWSASALREWFGVSSEVISVLPYPINLGFFRPEANGELTAKVPSLRVLWLGRVVPRKRLDVFLDGAEQAIRMGVDVRLTIVGQIGFVPGYEKLIERFPFPERLEWIQSVRRADVPNVIRRHDVLVQPSDHEDFGSSVAEAQACGLPVIVGASNGNRDFLCARDVHLRDDSPHTLAEALKDLSYRKQMNCLGDAMTSRKHAERHFEPECVCEGLYEILRQVARPEDQCRMAQ